MSSLSLYTNLIKRDKEIGYYAGATIKSNTSIFFDFYGVVFCLFLK